MSSSSPRQELLKLHQRLYKNNKKLIRDSILHEDPYFRAYESHYRNSTKKYQKKLSFEELIAEVQKSQIVYVGDYHTLNQSQKSFLRLLRYLRKTKKEIVVSLEMVQARYQAILESYLQNKIQETHFLKKIAFRDFWLFDLWDHFKPLFDFFKYHQMKVYGIEADMRLKYNLKQRDEFSAQKIHDIFLRHPEALQLVFIGDLHIAPKHLPQLVLKKLSDHKIKDKILYQNSETIYWDLAQRRQEHQTSFVKISSREYCRMHTPPIIVQQSYLNWLMNEERELDFEDARATFLSYMKQVASFLKISLKKNSLADFEVYTCGDLSFLSRIKSSGLFSVEEVKMIKSQILHSESYYIPKMKLAYLANVSVNHASEEASHALRHLCAGDEFPRYTRDAFYMNALHEAMGFFGSKIINHKRKCLRPAEARRRVKYFKQGQYLEERQIDYDVSKLFLEHENLLKKQKLFSDKKIESFSKEIFLASSHCIGYYLGEKIFYSLLARKIKKKVIRELFFDPMEDEGDPLQVFLDLDTKVMGIKLPRRT